MSDLAKALALVHHDLANADLLLGLAIDRCEDAEWDYRKGIMAEMREEVRRLSETAEALFDRAQKEEPRWRPSTSPSARCLVPSSAQSLPTSSPI